MKTITRDDTLHGVEYVTKHEAEIEIDALQRAAAMASTVSVEKPKQDTVKLWVLGTILKTHRGHAYQQLNISYQYATLEAHAIGQFVKILQDTKPEYSISEVVCMEVPPL